MTTSRTFAFLSATALLAGCSAQPSGTETPADHPANAQAAETAAPQPSQTLRGRTSTSSVPSGAGQADTAPAVYTCPHHPEVTSNTPGVCPKCEMKLQPKAGGPGTDSPAGAAGGTSGSGQSHGGNGGH